MGGNRGRSLEMIPVYWAPVTLVKEKQDLQFTEVVIEIRALAFVLEK